MSNALYDTGREAFLDGNISWATDNIKCCLVDADVYTVALGVDSVLDDVSGIVSTSGNFTGKTTAAGVAGANDVTLSSASGSESEAIVIYQDTGVSSTSRLIAYIDTATGLPVTPNGGDITIQWDTGVNKIFKL